MVGRPNDAEVILSAIEKGVQDEMDEQLRILNEKSIKDKDLRALIIQIRDDSYDIMAMRNKDETTLEKE